MTRRPRRAVLRACSLAIAGLAGCSGRESGATEDPTSAAPDTRAGPTSDTPRTTSGGTATTVAEGEVRWRASPGTSFRHPPAVVGGTVYAATTRANSGGGTPTAGADERDSRRLAAVDAASGSTEWTAPLAAGAKSAPTVRDQGLVLVTGWDGLHGHEYGLEAWTPDGDRRWRVPADRYKFLEVLGFDADAAYLGQHDDNLAAEGETVTAVDPSDGSRRWQVGTGDVSGGTVGDDGVYVAEYAGALSAYDRTGRRLWRREVTRPPGRPAVVDDVVYLLGETLAAYDAADGEPRWEYGGGRLTGIRLTGQRAYAVSRGAVHAVAADGGRHWHTTVEAVPRSAPTVLEDTVLVVAGDGTVLGLDAADGSVRWRADAGGSGDQWAVVPADPGAVVVGRDAGTVTAVAPDGGSRRLLSIDCGLSPPAIDRQGVYVGTDGGVLLGLAR